MNQQEARDAEIKARQDTRLYYKAYHEMHREKNKERLQQYEKERYLKRKSMA